MYKIKIGLTEDDIRALHYKKYGKDGLVPISIAQLWIQDMVEYELYKIKIDNEEMKLAENSPLLDKYKKK